MKNIQIGHRVIGEEHPTYIIAEVGINHNGDIKLAEQLIDVAAEAKVDAVKFQKRHLASLYRKDILEDTSKYEQYFQYMIPILKEVELAERDLARLKAHAEAQGLEFLCTPFDLPSVDCLERLGVRAYKIASADLTNLELLDYVADLGKPMLVSTGMSHWEEIEKAVKLLQDKEVAFALLHCRSAYPVWAREVNLRMINRLSQFGCPVGYSGHDVGIVIPLVAASMGAAIIEKHITLNKGMAGPDHKFSLEPFELNRLVRDIRVADQAMGHEKRFLLRGEVLNRELFGKSLLAATDISAGTRISRDMIRVKGPGKGLSPSKIDALIGSQIQRDLQKGDFFIEDDLSGRRSEDFVQDFVSRWGLIARFSDFQEMVIYDPRVIEFHLAEHDFELGFHDNDVYSQELVIHAPEYMGERLLDLCSADEAIRVQSIDLAQQTVNFTRTLSSRFQGIPKVIVHPGAMSLNTKLNKEDLKKALIQSLHAIDSEGVHLLLENLPPYPWYFGGQWKGNYFMDAEEICSFCKDHNVNICFDLSHAALYCNAKDKDLSEYIVYVKPFIHHIHFADAYGLDGEGVQINEGDIDFDRIMPLFAGYRETWVPEIWRGHLQGGRGFREALARLGRYDL